MVCFLMPFKSTPLYQSTRKATQSRWKTKGLYQFYQNCMYDSMVFDITQTQRRRFHLRSFSKAFDTVIIEKTHSNWNTCRRLTMVQKLPHRPYAQYTNVNGHLSNRVSTKNWLTTRKRSGAYTVSIIYKQYQNSLHWNVIKCYVILILTSSV
jgi:hypothetical protein